MSYYSLPYPPTDNHYYTVARGRKILSMRGREYRDWVYGNVLERGGKPLRGRLEAQVQLTMPDRRKRDICNVLKALMDALQYAGAFEDDAQLDRVTVQRGEVSKPGRVQVWLKQV